MAYTTTTLADLQTLMAQRWDQVVFWTPEEARLAINEALRDWNLLTGRWRTRVTLPVTAGTPEIDLPAAMTYAMRITTAAGQPLIPTSLAELDLGRPTWRLETARSSDDAGIPHVPTLWAPVSLRRIAIWPTYGDAGRTLLLDGVMRTPVLVNPTDLVDVGDEVLYTLVDFALHVVAFKEAAERWRATRPYLDAFLQAAAEENSLLKTHEAYRRWAGLDRRRDLQPSTGAPSQMDQVASQFSTHDTQGAAAQGTGG